MSVYLRMNLIGAALVSCLCLAVRAQNNFSPGGPDYPVVGALIGDQVWPDVAVNTNGGWLVWQDNAALGYGFGVRAVRLNANFVAVGNPFRVHQATNYQCMKPRVALLPDGGAAVVWHGGQPGREHIYMRIVNSNGTFRTGDVLVSSYTNGPQVDPVVTVLDDGSVFVVWSSFEQDGSLQGVFGQRLSATGTKLGSEFQINQYSLYNQRSPAVANLGNGRVLVVWISEFQRYSYYTVVDVVGRFYSLTDQGLQPAGSEFVISGPGVVLCANPTIVPGADGKVLVSWSQNDSRTTTAGSSFGTTVSAVTAKSTNSWDVWARVLGIDGSLLTQPFRVNSYGPGRQFGPRGAAFGKNFLVVWISDGQDGSREGVFGQFISAAGEPVGSEFMVNTTTASRQLFPVVGSDGASRFIVVWSQFAAGTGFDLAGRVYDLIRLQMTAEVGGMRLSWNTYPGGVYQVQTSADSRSWVDYGAPRQAVGYTDSILVVPTNASGFYRVIRIQ